MSLDHVATYRALAGKFVVLEGIDGSGTTTQAARLRAGLERHGVAARVTQEPSGGPLGRYLRQLLAGAEDAASRRWDCMALLFAADRLDHLAREIEPALHDGEAVVCDRYDLSSLAYQSATAPAGQDPVPFIRAINGRARRPDLTLVLDIAPEVAEARRARRGEPVEIFEERELQQRLARLYAGAEQLVPGDRVLHVAAEGTEHDVEAALLGAVRHALLG